MELEFNILWIEDDREFYDNWIDHIEGLLTQYNLSAKTEYKKYVSDHEVGEIRNKYDLILVDYNLSNDKYGTEIIKSIRHKALLPDIIFYSSAYSIESILEKEREEKRPDLLSILQNGIYYTHADNLTDVVNKVIKKIVSRELKINGFKGMVLSSVSEYEYCTNLILENGLKHMCKDQMQNLKDYISKEILEKQLLQICECNESFEKSELEESLKSLLSSDNRNLDHYKRVRIMSKMMKNVFDFNFDFESYKRILNLRNCLGHVPNNPNESKEEIFIEMSKNNKIKFDKELVVSTRRDIQNWNDIFKELVKKIMN